MSTNTIPKRFLPSPEKERARVVRWNAQYAVGTAVEVRLDDGQVSKTKTRSPAQMLGGHTAVVWLEGISGAYRLDRCTPIIP